MMSSVVSVFFRIWAEDNWLDFLTGIVYYLGLNYWELW